MLSSMFPHLPFLSSLPHQPVHCPCPQLTWGGQQGSQKQNKTKNHFFPALRSQAWLKTAMAAGRLPLHLLLIWQGTPGGGLGRREEKTTCCCHSYLSPALLGAQLERAGVAWMLHLPQVFHGEEQETAIAVHEEAGKGRGEKETCH